MAETKDSKGAADAKEAAPSKSDAKQEKSLDETVPGGRYQVGDKIVNANGEEIEE